MKTKTKKRPSREKEPFRRTTLSLGLSHWNWLLAVEKNTGARPSVTARKAIQRAMEAGRTDP